MELSLKTASAIQLATAFLQKAFTSAVLSASRTPLPTDSALSVNATMLTESDLSLKVVERVT